MKGFLVLFALVSMILTSSAWSYEGTPTVSPKGVAYFDGGAILLNYKKDGTVEISDFTGNIVIGRISSKRVEEVKVKISALTTPEEVKAVLSTMRVCSSNYFLDPTVGCIPRNKPY